MIWKLSGSEDAMDMETVNRFFFFSFNGFYLFIGKKINQIFLAGGKHQIIYRISP